MSTRKSILFVPFYVGELGWEIINYIPHVKYIVDHNNFSEIHVVVKQGHEAIYPMATHFYTASLNRDKSMGNSGDDLPKHNNSVFKGLKKNKSLFVSVVDAPKPGMRFYKKRSFLEYKSTCDGPVIPSNSVILCVRGRKFGKHKNWSSENWRKLSSYLISKNYTPVLVGITGENSFDPVPGSIDLRDKTTLEELISLMHRCKFVMGGSTGTTHLAALCGVCHVVWGSRRIEERYLKSWNPFMAPVEFHACKKEFVFSLDEGIKLAQKMIKRLEFE